MQQTSLNLFKAFNSGGSCFGGGSSGRAVRNSVEMIATYFFIIFYKTKPQKFKDDYNYDLYAPLDFDPQIFYSSPRKVI